ncbi:MAG: cytoplasmic protein [Candidatus Riflebacteria bacterium]|nr:cytoplasmic protein [Candidatus Riflebacteria bacterium]
MMKLFGQRRAPQAQGQFRQMNATQLYCPTCRQAMPVREKLALFVPSGAIYHYVCVNCDTMLGRKEDSAAGPRL